MDMREAGQKGGLARAKRLTKAQRSKSASHAVKAGWAMLTPEQRSERARRAALARHNKNKNGAR